MLVIEEISFKIKRYNERCMTLYIIKKIVLKFIVLFRKITSFYQLNMKKIKTFALHIIIILILYSLKYR